MTKKSQEKLFFLLICFSAFIYLNTDLFSFSNNKDDWAETIKRQEIENIRKVDISNGNISVYLRAKKLILMLEEKQFDKIEEFVQTQIALEKKQGKNLEDSTIHNIIRNIDNGSDIGGATADEIRLFITFTNEYMEKYKDSFFPYLLRGALHYSLGWEARGNGFANKVKKWKWKEFYREIELAVKDYNKSLELYPDYQIALAELMDIYEIYGNRKQSDYYYNRLRVEYPRYKRWITAHAINLLPKWRGNSAIEALDFLRDTMKDIKGKSIVPAAIISIHESLSYDIPRMFNNTKSTEEADELAQYLQFPIVKTRKEYLSIPEVWYETTKIAEEMHRDFPTYVEPLATYAQMAADIGRYDIAVKYFTLAIENAQQGYLEYRYAKYNPLLLRSDLYLKNGKGEITMDHPAVIDLKYWIKRAPHKVFAYKQLAYVLSFVRGSNHDCKEFASMISALEEADADVWW